MQSKLKKDDGPGYWFWYCWDKGPIGLVQEPKMKEPPPNDVLAMRTSHTHRPDGSLGSGLTTPDERSGRLGRLNDCLFNPRSIEQVLIGVEPSTQYDQPPIMTIVHSFIAEATSDACASCRQSRHSDLNCRPMPTFPAKILYK
ncbi:hypothetical protein DM860_013585 [Cuscuta australis]|uniref:Uncharacterized protein n=1 Tax=Cuscuta australis TaxID=267555 RepID=A0A328EE75_9ASTE|nr:hypothetical protein DM860_013585 [Cuscuta australis]